MTPESETPQVRSWRRATIVAVLLSIMLAAVALVSFSADSLRIKRVDLPMEIIQCSIDSDCVLVSKIGCCPCQAGGAQWAINKAAEHPLRRFLKRTCRRSGVCTRVHTCRDDLVPACVAGRCGTRIVDG